MDLVRAESAGFLDIAALEIDPKRGDLWVASTGGTDGTGMLHRIQLLSGRSLRAFPVAPATESVNLVDLSVATNGTVVVLDSKGTQLFVLRPGGSALEPGVKVGVQEATSVAVNGDAAVAIVSHRDGLSRIDLRTKATTVVSLPATVTLGHLERIRWHGTSLIAVQRDGDGADQIVRLDLNTRGTAVTKATTLAVPPSVTGRTFATISGDELLYLTPPSGGTVPDAASRGGDEFVAYRIPLR